MNREEMILQKTRGKSQNNLIRLFIAIAVFCSFVSSPYLNYRTQPQQRYNQTEYLGKSISINGKRSASFYRRAFSLQPYFYGNEIYSLFSFNKQTKIKHQQLIIHGYTLSFLKTQFRYKIISQASDFEINIS